MNGRDLKMVVDEAEKMILDIAKGDIDIAEIAEILVKAIKKN
jgi:prophage maintenance system killer protein